MVVRMPDFKGELYTRGRVIVPCHTTFNRRKNILTEVAYSEDKSKVQVNQIVSKISNSSASNVPDSQIVDNEYELWNRRLNRWWGWNWQRKRKECMTKFGHQFGDYPAYNSQDDNLYSNQCRCQSLYDKSNKEMDKTIMKSVRDTETQTLPKLLEYTCGFTRVYRGRLRRNKHNNEYEGLLPEVQENADAKIKRKKRCLHIHLLKVHSNIFLNKNKTIIQTHIKSKNIRRSDPDVTSSKIEINNTNVSVETNAPELPSTNAENIVHAKSAPCLSSLINSHAKYSENNPLAEQAIVEELNPTNSKQDTNPSEHTSDWQKNYNKLKEEHNELLLAVCEILCEKPDGVSTVFNKTTCECSPEDKTQNTENIADKENSK